MLSNFHIYRYVRAHGQRGTDTHAHIYTLKMTTCKWTRKFDGQCIGHAHANEIGMKAKAESGRLICAQQPTTSKLNLLFSFGSFICAGNSVFVPLFGLCLCFLGSTCVCVLICVVVCVLVCVLVCVFVCVFICVFPGSSPVFSSVSIFVCILSILFLCLFLPLCLRR